MVLTPNDLFSWNNKYSKYKDIYINNAFTFYLLAMHINSLCACWHPEVVKESSSLSSRRLLISPRITSSLFLCLESTDAPCSRPEDPAPPFPRWRSHSQGPRTPPSQGPTHLPPAFQSVNCSMLCQHNPFKTFFVFSLALVFNSLHFCSTPGNMIFSRCFYLPKKSVNSPFLFPSIHSSFLICT